MSDWLRELYQESIMDHSRNPRGLGKLDRYSISKESFNPLCGDRVIMYISQTQEGALQLSFEGSGCAMCIASTSLLLESCQGLSCSQAQALLNRLFLLLRADSLSSSEKESLGKLIILQSVKQYPSRVKCVTLSWHALNDLLASMSGPLCL